MSGELRQVGDDGRLNELADRVRAGGRHPYVIPGGASEHRLGSFGYIGCAAEIADGMLPEAPAP